MNAQDMMAAEEAEPQIQLSLPMSTFELAKGFIAGLSQSIAAAEAQLKAEEKAIKAETTMNEAMSSGAGLAGFGQELSAMSDQQLGIGMR